jgi:hypothetical protein
MTERQHTENFWSLSLSSPLSFNASIASAPWSECKNNVVIQCAHCKATIILEKTDSRMLFCSPHWITSVYAITEICIKIVDLVSIIPVLATLIFYPVLSGAAKVIWSLYNSHPTPSSHHRFFLSSLFDTETIKNNIWSILYHMCMNTGTGWDFKKIKFVNIVKLLRPMKWIGRLSQIYCGIRVRDDLFTQI